MPIGEALGEYSDVSGSGFAPFALRHFSAPTVWRKTADSDFVAGPSFGTGPRIFAARRDFAFGDALAFVV